MKKFFTLLFFSVFALTQAQYTTYTINGVGTISISDDMELQDGVYKQGIHGALNQIGYDTQNRVVFQPNGINDFNTNRRNTYARVIVETFYKNTDPLTNAIPYMSAQDKQELNATAKQMLIYQFQGTKIKLLEFYGVDYVIINNQLALKISYKRRLGDNPPVRVDTYSFDNRDRTHSLTISYRLADEAFWKNKLKHTLNSFKIIKR